MVLCLLVSVGQLCNIYLYVAYLSLLSCIVDYGQFSVVGLLCGGVITSLSRFD